jgi:hypothetical protein
MARLKYYSNENEEFKEEFSQRMTDTEVRYIYGRLKARYKIRQDLTLTNAVRGNCGRWEIKVEHEPSVGILAHEVAHAIQYKKRHKGQKWHCKKHRTLMKGVLKVIRNNFDEWCSMANKKAQKKRDFRERDTARKKALKEQKNTIPYKLMNTRNLIKSWKTKQKRAENALKKLERRKKLYESLLAKREQALVQA